MVSNCGGRRSDQKVAKLMIKSEVISFQMISGAGGWTVTDKVSPADK